MNFRDIWDAIVEFFEDGWGWIIDNISEGWDYFISFEWLEDLGEFFSNAFESITDAPSFNIRKLFDNYIFDSIYSFFGAIFISMGFAKNNLDIILRAFLILMGVFLQIPLWIFKVFKFLKNKYCS